jgi:hypothetical protein
VAEANMKLKRMALINLILFGLAGLALCQENMQVRVTATNAAPSPAVAQTARTGKGDSLTVIGHLEKRGRVITIKSGSKGVVYSVATRDGKLLFENVSAEQLKAQAPEIHNFITTSVANDARVRISAVQR